MLQWLKKSGPNKLSSGHKLRFFIPTSLKPDDVDLFQSGHFDPAEFKKYPAMKTENRFYIV